MKSFDDFWNDVAIPQMDKASEQVLELSKNADSIAAVVGAMIPTFTRKILEGYHTWLLQNFFDQDPD